jgi:TniQ
MSLEYPSRALLLSQRPIGMGTKKAESIVSFLSRVPPENNLTFGELMWGKVMERHELEHPDMAIVRGIGIVSLAEASVSVSETGLKFAEALARLTGRTIVRLMNWHASTTGVSLARLMRKHQAWCPQCLAGDKVPYFRMLWDLELATACDRHRCRLAHACARCGCVQRRYKCVSSAIRCQRCDHPLAAIAVGGASFREIAIAGELGELVAEVTGERLTLSGEQMKHALFAWAEQQGAKSVKTKARLLGMPQSVVSYWRNADRKPSLQRLLELCFQNGLPALEICRGNLTVTQAISSRHKVCRAWRLRMLSEEHKKDILMRLEAIAALEYPPYLKHAAIELGVAAKTLKALAPQTCEIISKRSDAQRNLIATVRFLRFQNKVKRYVNAKVSQGEAPSMRDIASILSAPGVLRSPDCRKYARAEIKQAKAKLSANRVGSS